VASVDEAKEELKKLIEFLKNPQEYGRLGARTAAHSPEPVATMNGNTH
jgi:ATP-dependent Zn protease